MVIKVAVAVVAFIGLFLIYVALQPAEFKVVRELAIQAPPEKLFPYINNNKKANDWMPWAESDPGAKMVYSGPDEGVGSTSSWDSSGDMGTGQAVVVESSLNQSVKTQLTYTKPMVMSQLAEVSLVPQADGTLVRWSVEGNNSFVGRIFCTFMNMDKMIGDQFLKGLNNLKKIAEINKGEVM